MIEADGYKFDLGPTFFLYPQILQEIFQEVGRALYQEVPMTKLDPQYRIPFGAGGELNATPDLERMVGEIAKLSPSDAQGFRRFMEYNRVKLEKFAPCLQMPFPGWTSLISLRLLMVLPFLKPWKSLHAELAGYFKDPRLPLAFTFQAKCLRLSPFVPTDEAYAKLPQGTVESRRKLENQEKLAVILTCHVVAGKVMAAGLKTMEVNTVNGQELDIKVTAERVVAIFVSNKDFNLRGPPWDATLPPICNHIQTDT